MPLRRPVAALFAVLLAGAPAVPVRASARIGERPPVFFTEPARGTFESGFGMRWGVLHPGIDIAKEIGTPVVVSAPGVVARAEWHPAYGNTVRIDHGSGLMTLYAHLSVISVIVGQPVKRGQLVGEMGATGNATGPHLHFEVRVHGTPTDPMPYLLRGESEQPSRVNPPAGSPV